MRDRVTLAHETRVDDGDGGSVVSVTPLAAGARIAAEVRSATARERLQPDGTETIATHVVTLRAVPGVGPTTRVTWGARVLQVIGTPDLRDHGRVLVCTCAERV